MEFGNKIADFLRQGTDTLVNLPSEAQRFITNPQAFTQLLTGKNPLPRETGFAAGATGLTPDQISVLDPNQMEYMKGYEQGEPFGIAAMALPLAVPAAKALAPKAGQMAENYMVNQGMMPSIVPPSPAKVADALRQPEKNALGFYSPLDEAVLNLQNQKGTGQQYLAQLLKTQGVKQEEVATRGLDTFLNQNPKVTKTQIEDFLGQNPVNIRETVLGVPEKFDADRLKQLETEYAGLKQHAIDDPKFGELKYDEMIRLQNIRDNSTLDSLYARAEADERTAQRMQQLGLKEEADKYFKQAELLNTRAEKLDLEELGPVLPTKFGKADFNIPNGENYREVLIQMPSSSALDVANKNLDKFWTQVHKEKPNADLYDLTPQELAKYDELNNIALKADKKAVEFVNRNHFEQPNILTHMRVDDRVIDGKKTLFIQEIQSDWHQAGRKKGYGEKDVPAPTIMKVKEYINPYVNNKGKSFSFGVVDNGQLVSGNFRTEAEALAEIERLRGTVKQMGVPNAPFKNTEQWAGLAMKRAMQMAAEGGYDRVAFTTGKQQADRYSLQKQVNMVSATPTKDGKYNVYLEGKDGDPLFRNRDGFSEYGNKTMTPEEMEATVGKEVTRKLIEGKPNKEGWVDVRDKDLTVGGEGMIDFYDKILPNFVNKYGKKNNLRVGKTKMRTSTDKQAAEDAKLLNDLGVSKGGPNAYEDVHYFDLTPEAKTSFLSKGQPMFAAAPIVATDEETRREMLEKLFNNQK